MEILQRDHDLTVWIGKDAEGRTMYGATINAEDGTPVEPLALNHYTMTEAILSCMVEEDGN